MQLIYRVEEEWYISNVSIIFDAPCLFIYHLLCVLLHFVAFLCIFRNLPTNEMPQCQFSVFWCFCVSEKLHRKYSQNWTKQKPKFLFFPIRDGVQSRDGGGPEGGHHPPRWGSPPGRAGDRCGPLVHLLTSPFRLYILLDEKTLSTRSIFKKTYCKPPPSLTRDREGREALPGTPTGEGNHHRRPSSSPCLPPEWCVSSLSWTTGP
jgi:hypothetical protein